MTLDSKSSYLIAFIVALALHVVLLTTIFLNFHWISKPRQQTMVSKPVKVIDAVAINQQQLAEEVAQIKAKEAQKHRQENERLAKLQRELAQTKLHNQQAAKKLAQTKAKQQIAAKQQKIAEQKSAKKLASLKAKQAAEQERLTQERKKADAEHKRLQQVNQKKQQETKRLAELEKQRKLAEKKQQQARSERLLQDKLAEEDNLLRQAREQRTQDQIDKYSQLIKHAIGERWRVPDSTANNLSCIFLIRLAPNGSVLDVKLVRSSGDSVLDRSARSAVYQASPLPVPHDPEVFAKFREIRLLVRPEGYL